MKSPKVKGIGEVVTEYGAKVMKIFKKGLLGRSLFDFYGDVKAQTFRTKESASAPSTPTDGAGGIMYTKSADGKLYYKSNEVSEVEISSTGTTLTTEEVQDIVGAMFTSNTETRISASYEDSDGTIDLVVDAIPVDLTSDGAGTIHANNVPTLNQDTTGTSALAALATTANIAKGVTGTTDADVLISSDGDIIVTIDSDGDETDSLVLFRARTVEIGRIDELGNATFPGVVTAKQYQVFPSNFIDDINTSLVFIPIHGTTFEQSQAYQDDTAIVAPCDGRIVSVTLNIMSVSSGADLTLTVYTLPPNTAGTGTFPSDWVLEESEQLSITSSSDNHVLNFAFSNDKHFESTEKFVVAIQASSDPGPNAFMYATTVVEWDYSTLLSTTAEHSSVP